MAVIASRASKPVAEASSTSTSTMQVYTSAVVLAVLSLVLMLLIIPPMFWHARNRNIGATALIAWLLILLLSTFTNATIWPSDNIPQWYDGLGYCDIQVKVIVGAQVALPASFACILRALAAVLDTDRATFIQTKAQKRRSCIIDLLCCIGVPLLQILLHYVVQTRRYYIQGISGCVPAVSSTWPTIPLMILPTAIWTVVDVYLAVLILIQLYRYRLSFNAILSSSNTTKSRFMRLYVICAIWIVATIPVQAYALSLTVQRISTEPYSWNEVHDSKVWHELVMFPSHGTIRYDRWVWLACALVVFIFFGFGRDAITMYRTALLTLGMGRMFPGLKSDTRTSTPTSTSSFGSRAKMLFKRKSSASSYSTRSTSTAAPLSPRGRTFLDTIDESDSAGEKYSTNHEHPNQSRLTLSTNNVSTLLRDATTALSKWLSTIGRARPQTTAVRPPRLNFQQTSVESTVSSDPRSESLSQQVRSISLDEMLVRKEVRQASLNQG